MAAKITTSPKIGGPGKIVEVSEAKFGKRKYQRGRRVRGSWVEWRDTATSAFYIFALTTRSTHNAVEISITSC